MAQPLINPKNNETQSYIFITLIFLSVASKAFQAGCSTQCVLLNLHCVEDNVKSSAGQ